MNNRVIGGNFIIVDSRRPVVKEDPCSTSGNQKWNGAKPSFIEMAAVSTKHETGWVS